jgi:hypothetical protein
MEGARQQGDVAMRSGVGCNGLVSIWRPCMLFDGSANRYFSTVVFVLCQELPSSCLFSRVLGTKPPP